MKLKDAPKDTMLRRVVGENTGCLAPDLFFVWTSDNKLFRHYPNEKHVPCDICKKNNTSAFDDDEVEVTDLPLP